LEYAINCSGASAANAATPNCSIAPPSIASEAFGRAKAVAGNAASLARKLGITAQAMSQWSVVPAIRVLDVERITGVPRQELRPDMHPPLPIQQAKSPSPECTVFTNCGKAETQESPVKRAQKKLKRVPFTVSRLMEFCTHRELVNQTGHQASDWPLVVLKELTDNALDACEEAEIAPVIEITVVNGGDSITIADNGSGIPAKTIDGVLDYSIRVSSREAYCSPTRGAQGNALKTILPMSYVLDEGKGEERSSTTIIEARGLAHRIVFGVDHIRQEPKIEHTTNPSPVTSGTKITVTLPLRYQGWAVDYARDQFLRLAESYAWLNPHLTLRVSWDGKSKIDVAASDPTWSKWLPTWPTSAHWYDVGRFRRYMAAHIANRGTVTVREFISEFRGMTGTAKQKEVLAETGASHVSLHNYFGRHRANTENIAKLLTTLKTHTKPVPPADLGIIGKAHLYGQMERVGGDPKTFTYNRTLGDTSGLPRVVEFAFGIQRSGFEADNNTHKSRLVTGVNWSAAINNPFRSLGRSGEGLDSILRDVRANASEPVIAVLHVACPRVAYTDRGKTAIVVEGGDDAEED
jgi:DNA-binding transcriptional regulator YdaS (Cro superfamily)